MKILVCGGREYKDWEKIYSILDKEKPTEIIEGGARGADTIAREWAKSRKVPYKTYPANWDKYKKAAGPIRNQEMIDKEHPDKVLAFPDPNSRGTYDMIDKSNKKNIPTEIF